MLRNRWLSAPGPARGPGPGDAGARVRGAPHGTGLATFRWVVERTISWLHGFRRLRIRWERCDDIHEAFLGLPVCLINHRHVQMLCQGQ
ncbi:hypothetical protein GCM10010394_47930 [Streptomyces crystallinus]|uniref:Transposase IS4-like domain-containing protein n=1 Tax=Streptomyces crystallinus TaxID=68191 RepID=A0ABN1GJ39_9ACTN